MADQEQFVSALKDWADKLNKKLRNNFGRKGKIGLIMPRKIWRGLGCQSHQVILHENGSVTDRDGNIFVPAH